MALEVLSEAQAARMASLRTRQLAKLRREGRGPSYTMLGRNARYLITDVEHWLKANRIVAVYPCEIIEKGDQP